MIIFKRYGKTVRISNRHWESLRRRFNPDNAKQYGGSFKIYKCCLLCLEHHGCKRCGFYEFEKGTDTEMVKVGCLVFLRRLFKNKVAFYAGDSDVVTWHKGNDAKARRQLNQIQKFMDEIEAQQ